MTAQQFLDTPLLQDRVKRSMQKQAAGEDIFAADAWLVELHCIAEQCKSSGYHKVLLRFIAGGDDLFVSQDGDSPAAKGLQADLNAAANIGLRNLLHPDWSGSWAYIPVKRNTGATDPQKLSGSPLLAEPIVLLPDEQDRKEAVSDILNAWRSPSADPLTGGGWKSRKRHLTEVEEKVVQQLREYVGMQLSGKVETPF
jgi:hypothetical protein